MAIFCWLRKSGSLKWKENCRIPIIPTRSRSGRIRIIRRLISEPAFSRTYSQIGRPNLKAKNPANKKAAMKWLSAGLIFVSLSTVIGLILGMIGHGLGTFAALASLLLGGLCAIAAYFETSDPKVEPGVSKNAGPLWRYRNIWVWLVGVFFLMFAVRSFCWLLYIDGDQFRIQSPNNLGDLALHITYIRNFASGVSFWPDNPIYVFSKLRYPAGIDLFNALLCKVDVDLIRGLVWVGLLASAATFYAFYRWSGAFGSQAFCSTVVSSALSFLRHLSSLITKVRRWLGK